MEGDLLEKLRGNSPYARPVLNASNPVIVKFGFELIHIVAVQESEQTVKQKLWLRMSWRNELMTWQPDSWDGINTLRLDPASVWKPDVFLQEDVSGDMAMGPEKYKTQVNIMLFILKYFLIYLFFCSLYSLLSFALFTSL